MTVIRLLLEESDLTEGSQNTRTDVPFDTYRKNFLACWNIRQWGSFLTKVSVVSDLCKLLLGVPQDSVWVLHYFDCILLPQLGD